MFLRDQNITKHILGSCSSAGDKLVPVMNKNSVNLPMSQGPHSGDDGEYIVLDVGEPSSGTKVPTFGKSLKTFVSKGCIFEKLQKPLF